VLKEFESKSPEEIMAARIEWDTQQLSMTQFGFKARTFEEMIKDRFADSDPATYERMQALLNGNVGKDKALELRQGMADHDQEKIEAALADPDLASKDEKKRAEAQERRKQMQETMVEEDKLTKEGLNLYQTGKLDDTIQGSSMEDQVHAYYAKLKDDPLKGANLSGDPISEMKKLEKAGDHAENDEIGTDELMAQGKFTVATQIHRAREDGDKKESAAVIDKIETTKERDEDEAEYEKKYKQKMFKDPLDTLNPMQRARAMGMDDPTERDDYIRDHMTRNEMLEDNMRQYGAHAERDVVKEQQLQQELYDKQASGSLEFHEMLRGGGTQLWAREELAARQKVLDDGTRDAQGNLDAESKEKADRLDQGASTALATQEEEKVKLGEHLAHVFSTIAKIGALLIGQPELIFLADMASSLTEMAIKASVEGEAYDASTDEKMMMVTAMADAAFIGFSKLGEAKNLAAANKVDAAETTEKLAKAGSAEQKAKIVGQEANTAAGEALGSKMEETAAQAARSDRQAGDAVGDLEQDLSQMHEGREPPMAPNAHEPAVPHEPKPEANPVVEANPHEATAPHEMTDAERAAQMIDPTGQGVGEQALKEAEVKDAEAELKDAKDELDETREATSLPGKLVHGSINTLGGGWVNGEDSDDIGRKLVVGWLTELTGGLDKAAGKLLGDSEWVEAGVEFARTTGLKVAENGGTLSGDDVLEIGMSMGADRLRDNKFENDNEARKAANEKQEQKQEQEHHSSGESGAKKPAKLEPQAYSIGEAEREEVEPKGAEENEKKAKKREEDETAEQHDAWNDATNELDHEERK
jgi:hypothetical protein